MRGSQAAIYGEELRRKFNLHYDNIFSGASPGLNDYELSLLLTQAQREVLISFYNGTARGDSFDSSERLKSLLAGYTSKKTILADDTIEPTDPPTETFSYADAVLGNDVWFILKENLVFSAGISGAPKQTLVKPISHDDFWVLADNPLKSPDKYLTRAWRLDESMVVDDLIQRSARLVYSLNAPLVSYNFTYLIKPEPIIISDLTDSGTGFSIEGIEVMSEDDISIPDQLITDMQLRDYIINRAVELATRDYKQNNLESQVALNSQTI